MKKSSGKVNLSPTLVIPAVLFFAAISIGCSGTPTSGTPGTDGTTEQTVPLQQTVVAQQGQIATLQDQVTALQTSVASRPTAAPTARPPAIPTVGAIVQGIQVNGTTKGLASAKLVLDEYSDFQ